jgi:hypothetical protein
MKVPMLVWRKYFLTLNLVMLSFPLRTCYVNPRLVTWFRPMAGTVCLNVDGSLLGTTNTTGYGGFLRNDNGDFILGLCNNPKHFICKAYDCVTWVANLLGKWVQKNRLFLRLASDS